MARRISYGVYTEGNAARKIEFDGRRPKRKRTAYQRGSAVPVEKPLTKREQREERRQEKLTRRASYRHMDNETMGIGYVFFLTAMVVVVAILSLQYLNYQSEIKSTKRQINALQSQIEVVASQNDAVAYDIDGYVDINHIVDVATGELGMVRASESQIRYFDKRTDEFMNQYADVPEGN